MKRGRYQQQAIDYILANPGAVGPEIISGLGWHSSTGASRLQAMTVSGELLRSPALHYPINKLGRRQMQRTYAYWAI